MINLESGNRIRQLRQLFYGNAPGDYHYEDFNGDNVVNSSDFQVLGSGIPTQMIGFNNTFTYNMFTLNLFLPVNAGLRKMELCLCPDHDSQLQMPVNIHMLIFSTDGHLPIQVVW